MKEPKFKIGQEVRFDGCNEVATVIGVNIAGYTYDLKWRTGQAISGYRECSLQPYVRPLAVGDRVRWKTAHDASGVVRMIEDGEACYRADSGLGLIVAGIGRLERIPDDADIDSERKAVPS